MFLIYAKKLAENLYQIIWVLEKAKYYLKHFSNQNFDTAINMDVPW